MSEGPRREYEERLAACRNAAEAAESQTRQLARARLACFALAAAAAWFSLIRSALSPWVLVVLVASFAALVLIYDRTRRERTRALRAVDHYQKGLARIDYAFAGTGRSGDGFANAEHPYATHLDLFGRGSLFELLSTAHTHGGVQELADWLRTPAAPKEIRRRQEAVRELAPRVDLREDLAVLGPDATAELEPERLAQWRANAPPPAALTLRIMAAALAITTLLCAFVALPRIGAGPLFLVLVVQSLFALAVRAHVRRAHEELDRALANLTLLLEILRRIEAESFTSPALLEVQAALGTNGEPASREIARLRNRAELLRQSRNQFFAILAPFVLWSTQIAFSIESWRARCAPRLAGWLNALSRLEALLDLAGYAYEHPDDPFAEIVESGPRFDAHGLGHPLLPTDQCTRNDLQLGPNHALYVVSGSNMSGKSTLLRSVGTNTVLALAGAPVRADSLRISPLQTGASIVVSDSLQEGASRFYTEIQRLRAIVNWTDRELPVLFLLDEILAGTNSHDRGLGAAAMMSGLLERGAIGLLTTHDLALAQIAVELAPRAHNVHFEDQLVNGRMKFDYRLRKGVVTHSNALELMRAVGLEV